jgi:ABC-2 type transport system permease protein
MKKHLRILTRYFQVNLASAMEYRASFVSQAFGMLLSNATFVLFWWVLFQQVHGSIGGYGFRDVMFIWALASSAFGLGDVLFGNTRQLTRLIITGELDTFLLQPCNLLVNVCCARTSLSAYGDLAYGFLLLALTQGGDGQAWLFFLLGVPIGALLMTGLAIGTHSLTFYLGDASLIGGLSTEFVLNFSLYPEGIYPSVIRAVMYSLIPAAFVVHVPLRLARNFDPLWLAVWLAAAAIYCALSAWFFHRSLRRYESGNVIVNRI